MEVIVARKTDNAGQDVRQRRDCCCHQIISTAPGLRRSVSHNYNKPSRLSPVTTVSLSSYFSLIRV